MAEAIDDAGLAEQARTNTKGDFSHSPALQVVREDALWSLETASAEVLAAIRALPAGRLVQLALGVGLYERLREWSTG